MPDPAETPSEPRRTALLGQRKKNSKTPEKPVKLTRKEKAAASEPTVEIEAVRPTPRKRSSSREEVADTTPELTLEQLSAQLEELTRQLEERPRWEDLQALEARLLAVREAPAAPTRDELQRLRSHLRSRQEELEELSSVTQELQDQHALASRRIEELEQLVDQDDTARHQLESWLHQARLRAEAAEEQQRRLEARLYQADGFLREALLGLLSPGDEFNEELVEQIQTYLALDDSAGDS